MLLSGFIIGCAALATPFLLWCLLGFSQELRRYQGSAASLVCVERWAPSRFSYGGHVVEITRTRKRTARASKQQAPGTPPGRSA